MSRPRSRFPEALVALAATLGLPRIAHGQACCAGSGAVTPGRLAEHEVGLVGVQAKASAVIGSYDAGGRYTGLNGGSSEIDAEQDLFAAARVLPRAQVAMLVPLLQTHRAARAVSEVGGGLGDINVSARYDLTFTGERRLVPGIAVLFGLTLPTGTPPEFAKNPLATDATGIGAPQGNVGVAFEHATGPWLLGASVVAAFRASRTVSGVSTTLGAQWTGLVSGAYVLDGGAAIAAVLSVAGEGDSVIDGAVAARTSRHAVQASVAGVLPIADAWRLQGSVYVTPPLAGFGSNQTSTTGLGLAAIRAWM